MNTKKITLLIERIESVIFYVLVGLLPVFFLPFTFDYWDFNKQNLLFIAIPILLTLWFLKLIIRQKGTRLFFLDLIFLVVLNTP